MKRMLNQSIRLKMKILRYCLQNSLQYKRIHYIMYSFPFPFWTKTFSFNTCISFCFDRISSLSLHQGRLLKRRRRRQENQWPNQQRMLKTKMNFKPFHLQVDLLWCIADRLKEMDTCLKKMIWNKKVHESTQAKF